MVIWQVNVVVMRGVNDDELCEFVELTQDAAVNVRFIEYMPFDGNVWSDSKMVPYSEMLAAVQARYPQGLERCRVSAPAQESHGAVKVAINFWRESTGDCPIHPFRAILLP